MADDHDCVSVAFPAGDYETRAYLIAAPTRTGRQRVVAELSLTGLMNLPGYEATHDEVEEILFDLATAAAVVLAKRLPQLRALVEKKASAARDRKQH